MADLPTLLLASLAPDTRKQAEQALSSLADQPGFVEAVLRLVLDQNGDKGARLAGSVYLKNVVKRKWDDDAVEPSQQISPTDKAGLRQALVPAMIALSTPANKALRAQIAETVAVVARKDFPGEWGDLIDQLVNSLSPTEYNINLGVLETAHSIFSPWRSQVRSDALFTTINFVLGRFVDPYLALLRQTTNLLLGGDARAEVAGTMRVLVDLYHDLTCQDLPPAIEDSHLEFWGVDAAQGQQGVFLRFLEWDPVALRGDEEDATPSIPSLIKAGILEVAEMYTKLYPEMVSKSPTVEAIIRAVWALVGAGRLQGVAYDGLVTQALRFISSTIRSGHYKTLFSSPETISGLGEGVVVPNVMLREHDIEQFEDDPLEYVRLDLSATSGLTDSSTRRQAAADVLRALVAAGFEAETTRLAQGWVAQGLESYKVNRENGWRAKDSAVFVLSAVAARGGTAQAGVTSTNALIDIIDFFSNHVFGDLQPATPPAHPILAADAIRFLYTFRNQLTKEQLLSVLPLLVHHLGNPSYVVYTYAAVCIERILFIKQGGRLLFTQADVHDFAQGLLDALLSKIEVGGSAEKIAENDYLMKSAMRVILTARQTLTPGHAATLQRLVNILGVTAKNPSNPNFDQYLFESIAALIRFVVAGSPNTLPGFEQALFGPFTFIIQQEVEQYIPYAFQILAQMLALHLANGGVPDAYKSLLPFLLVPGPWEQKGSVPGLVALLRAYLAADARAMVAAGQHVNVLAIVQQRLIRSRINDAWGFELLRSVVQYVPSDALRPQLRAVLITLLTRMQESKTDGYVARFAHFILFAMALDGPGVITPDVWITESEGVQGGLWTTLLNTFVIPQVPKFQPRDRKMAAVGLTRMLSTPQMLQSAAPAWPPAFTALVQLFSQPQLLASAQSKATTEDEGGVSAIDVEEQAAGYQAAYSRLVAAEPVREDVVAYVPDPQAYVVQKFKEAGATSGGTLGQAVAAADQSVVGGFVGVLRGAGVPV